MESSVEISAVYSSHHVSSMKNTSINALLLLLVVSLLAACSSQPSGNDKNGTEYERLSNSMAVLPQDEGSSANAKAVFASGCFWCTEAVFERVEGVQEVISGYAGGTEKNPTYKGVSAGQSDHAEAVIVYYDSTVVNYQLLLDMFFHSHDPTQLNRQGPDVGKQYRSGIYYNSQYQQQLAVAYKKALGDKGEFDKPIVTEIKPLETFWPAEEYHQDYYKLNPDNPYIRSVSMPKVKKFEKDYQQYLKKPYQSSLIK